LNKSCLCKGDVRSQGGVGLVSTDIFGQGEGGLSDADAHTFCAKNFWLFEIYFMSARTRIEGRLS